MPGWEAAEHGTTMLPPSLSCVMWGTSANPPTEPTHAVPHLLNGSIRISPKGLLWGLTESLPTPRSSGTELGTIHPSPHPLAWALEQGNLPPAWVVWKVS